MRRLSLLVLLLSVVPVIPMADAQTKTAATVIPKSGNDPRGYRMTKDDGTIIHIKSFQKVGRFYKYVNLDDGTSQLFEASVTSIELMQDDYLANGLAREAEFDRTEKDRVKREESSAQVLASIAKTKAKTAPRTTARVKPRVDPPAYAPFVSGDPTTYVGPRGGHFHFSASGNKVYEKRR